MDVFFYSLAVFIVGTKVEDNTDRMGYSREARSVPDPREVVAVAVVSVVVFATANLFYLVENPIFPRVSPFSFVAFVAKYDQLRYLFGSCVLFLQQSDASI